jgi:hypothetical protein
MHDDDCVGRLSLSLVLVELAQAMVALADQSWRIGKGNAGTVLKCRILH